MPAISGAPDLTGTQLGRPRRHDLVAGGQDHDPWPGVHLHGRDARGGEQAQVGGPQRPPGGDEVAARGHVLVRAD
jgi:hypothetical protein